MSNGLNGGAVPNVSIADLGFHAMKFNATTNVQSSTGTTGYPEEQESLIIDSADSVPMEFPAEGTCRVSGPYG